MARGGFRPGAGRPPGAKSIKQTTPLPINARGISVPKSLRITEPPRLHPDWQTPLEYMLTVMNDEGADPARRDRLAIAAAPFLHGRPADARPGKKVMAEQAARTAGIDTEWGDDLKPSVKLN